MLGWGLEWGGFISAQMEVLLSEGAVCSDIFLLGHSLPALPAALQDCSGAGVWLLFLLLLC